MSLFPVIITIRTLQERMIDMKKIIISVIINLIFATGFGIIIFRSSAKNK